MKAASTYYTNKNKLKTYIKPGEFGQDLYTKPIVATILPIVAMIDCTIIRITIELFDDPKGVNINLYTIIERSYPAAVLLLL
ncbi:hypothetical protein TURU_159591 [Turdus rufiventris]|nr:hypothetical protein TURU_159591 [Turdus rufiventris]